MDLQGIVAAAFSPIREPVRALSVLLNDPAAFMLCTAAIIVIASFAFREQRRLPFALSAIALAILLGIAFKSFLQEERPCVFVPGKIPCPLDFALPSLHALVAFTLAIVAVGGRSFAAYLVYAIFVAFSRVYLGVHTISEVAAGLALAFLACVLAEMVWRGMRWKLPPEVRITHELRRLKD